jgi:O-antigen/teichoic acid export membrane protein
MQLTLREQVLRGGVYLVLRQGVGVALSFLGLLLLTRLIGPVSYGLYVTALGVIVFLSQVARVGSDVYLVRRQDDPSDAAYDQAFSLVLLSSLALSVLAAVLSPAVAGWLNDTRFLPPLWAMLVILPLAVVSAPAVARLERALEYRRVAVLELVEQVTFFLVALGLAWGGAGVWALVGGYGVSQLWLAAGSYALIGSRPRWHWSRPLLREMLAYGLGFSSSLWIWHLRSLVSPLVVGRYLGPEAVAYIALATRLVDGLSLIRHATWRLSIAALAKVQHEPPRLRRALEEAMGFQALALAPLLAAFALLSPWLVPVAFGQQWMPALSVFPFVAVGALVNATFSVHTSVLYVVKRNREVTVFHLVHLALLSAGALWLVPRLGLPAWGLAEVLALASYLTLHRHVSSLFAFGYRAALPWLLVFVPPIFTPVASWPAGLALWVPTIGLGFSSTARAQLAECWLQLRRRNA